MRWSRRIQNAAERMFALVKKRERRRFPLQLWMGVNHLTKPINDRQIVFLTNDDSDTLTSFATLCHERVQDRDESFTLDKRMQLYERWLSAKQPCLMAATDGSRQLVCASIILPLTADAYERFCSGDLDALDLEPHHIVKPDSGDTYRYLLIDMLATSKDTINELPPLIREGLRGIGFRAVLYHIARFFDPRHQAPVILCSTQNRPLGRLLRELEFADTRKQSGTSPIYRADLSRLDFYSRNVRKAFSLAVALAHYYKKRRAEADRHPA